MVIVTGTAKAFALNAAGQENNPFVAHDNIGKSATVTTVTGTEVFPAVNAVSAGTYNFWEATPAGGFATVRFSFPAPVTLGFIGIAAHNFATVQCAVRIQYSTNGGTSWTTEPGTEISPADNKALGFRFSDRVAQDWRVLTRDHAVAGNVRVGVILLSKEILIPQRLYQGYAPAITPTKVEAQTNVSEGGHMLAASAFVRGSHEAVPFEHVDDTFIRGADWMNFQGAFNKGDPCFWGWRPEKYPGDIHYAWREGAAIRPENSGPKALMSFSMNMRLFEET